MGARTPARPCATTGWTRPGPRGRLRESGIQVAETVIAGAAAGAAAATRSVSENQTMNVLRGGGDWLDRTLRIPRRPPGLAPPPDEVPAPQIIGRPSEVEPLLERAGQRAAEVERQAAQDIGHRAVRLAASGGGGSNGRLRFGGGGGGRGSGDGGGRGNGRSSDRSGRGRTGGGRRCGRSDRGTGGRGGGGGRGRHGLGHRGRSQRGLPPAGLGRRDGRRHGQRRLAALPSHGRADFERDARIGGHRPLLRAATAPAAAGLPDRHGFLSNRSELAPSSGRARAGSSPRPSASTRSPSR